jgi:ArsR family transcriptional regulator
MDSPVHRTAVLDRLAALSESTRSRVLLVLEEQELTVSELCTVLQLPQSTVSRHLKVLGDAGWLHVRPEGTKRYYALALGELAPTERRMWLLVREQVAASPASSQDRSRLESVLRERRSRSQEFFSSSGDWERMRRQLYGSRFDTLALLALLDEEWTVGDLGCGAGHLSENLAPFVDRVIAVDSSAAMLATARRRLDRLPNVELRRGDLEALPVADGELDAATLFLVLHHVAAPAEVLAEAARAVRPGGRLLVVDMLPHEREEYRQEMGHVWLGFSPETIVRQLELAGLERARVQPLPADPEARGPGLFAATGRRRAAGAGEHVPARLLAVEKVEESSS